MIMPKNILTLTWLSSVIIVWLAGSQFALAIEPMQVEYCWQSDPKLDVDWWSRNGQGMMRWNITAKHLQSDRAEVRMQAAQAIIKNPLNPSINREESVNALIDQLKQGEPRPSLRADYVAAVCELDDSGEHAEALWRLSEKDATTRPTVERALAKWGKPFAASEWRTRLRDKLCTQQELSMACFGIGRVGNPGDLGVLTAIVTDATALPSVRLVAAQAIGRVTQTEQLTLAQQLRASSALHGDLLAMYVLGEQSSPEVKEFVLDVSKNATLVAQREAYRWLCQHDPETARSLAMAFTDKADWEIRRLCVMVINQTDNADAIPLLFKMLGDVHPDVRKTARHQLLICSERSPENDKAVKAIIAPGLAKTDWQTKEQSGLFAVELKQTEHLSRLLELLEDPRPEVCITASWALRHLATDDPTLQAMLKHTQAWTEELKKQNANYLVDEYHIRRMAHLFDAFGVRKFEPAKELLLQYVPKSEVMGLMTRVSAIWSCGRLWEGQKNSQLTGELMRRIADKNNMFPEYETVRYTSTIALGWIADPTTRASVVANDEAIPNPIGYVTKFALECIDKAVEQK